MCDVLLLGPVNHYYLGFFSNADGDSNVSLLLMSTEAHHQVQYSIEASDVGYYHNGTISAGTVTILNIHKRVQVSTLYYRDQGIYLTTSSDKVTVIGQNLQARSSDSYFALPVVWLNEAYVFYGISVPRTSLSSNTYSSILIVGAEDHTVVYLTVTQSANIYVGFTNTFIIPGIKYRVRMNRLQTAYVFSRDDLSGTKMMTAKPVSVFSGHQCGNVPWNVHYCNHLIEQIPPTALWGTVHYVTPLASRTSYTIKILAAYDATNINIYCNNTRNFYSINEGEFINRTSSMQEYCVIHSTKKVLVVQFAHGEGDYYAIGDPTMTLVPSTNQYMNKFDFSTLSNSSFNHYVSIIVMAQYYQPSMIYLIVDGITRSLGTQQWVPIQVNSTTEAYATLVKIPLGITTVYHSDETSQLTVIVYGFAQGNGYGHIGGIHIPGCEIYKSNFKICRIFNCCNTGTSGLPDLYT